MVGPEGMALRAEIKHLAWRTAKIGPLKTLQKIGLWRTISQGMRLRNDAYSAPFP